MPRCAHFRSFVLGASAVCVLTTPLSLCGANRLPAPAAKETGAMAANANFVVSAPEQALADQVLIEAERLRDAIAVRWLSEKLPPGLGQTVIRVKLSPNEDIGLSWVADSQSRLSHLMWLTTSRELAVGSTLAHEMTHVVLATRYPGELPAFATEGAACEQDDSERIATRKRIVAWWAQTGNWPHVAEVLEARQIAPSDAARYALACSVTEFLLTRSSRATFLDFAVAGAQRGWPDAVREYYGFGDLMALQTAWRDWANESL
jgi:hypothetical protein